MKKYRRIGDLVDLIDERNKDEKVKTLIGVSIDKCFIKSVANTIGTDLSKYQVIRKFDFACSLMQVSRDGKIPIACLKDYDEAIMSPAYYIFRIKNTEEILPDYMAMWFMRPEFDREASYIAVGGVRGSMPWEDFCDMKLPVPPLNEQQKIVDTYNAITNRIQIKQKINENLEKTAQCLFEEIFRGNLQKEEISFTDVIKLSGGGTPSTTEPSFWQGNIPFFTPADINNSVFCLNTEKNLTETGLDNCSSRLYPSNTTFVSCRGTVGKLAISGVPMAMNQSCYALKDKESKYPFFTYSFSKYAIAKLKEKASGAVFSALVTRDFEMEKVFNPKNDDIEDFESKVKSVFDNIKENEREILILSNLRQSVVSQISKR